MKKNAFQSLAPNVENNLSLRVPQREGYAAVLKHYSNPDAEREVGIVLPVGCGKSGLLTISPFASKAVRVLVVAPGTRIAKQLGEKDFNPTNPGF